MGEDSGGWIKLFRATWSWRYSPIVTKRPFTRLEAWIWLISKASYQDHTRGEILVKRGQLLTSIEQLSKVWRRDRKTVRRWVTNMQKNGEVRSERGRSWTLLTICEYETYQGDGTPNGTPKGTSYGPSHSPPEGTQSRSKEIKKEKKGKNIQSSKLDSVEIIPFQIIVEHLNQVTGKDYRHKSETTRKLIRGRWAEGFRELDFFHVHLVKAEKWLGTEWEKFLRPVTLYGLQKFEGYLQERRGVVPMTDKARNNVAVGIQWLKSKGFSFDSSGTPRILSDAEQAGKAIPERTGPGND